MGNIAVLRVGLGTDGSLSCSLAIHGNGGDLPEGDAGNLQGPKIAALEQAMERMRDVGRGDLVRGAAEAGPASLAIPAALGRRIRQWATERPDHPMLCIACDVEPLLEWPWEALPHDLGLEDLSIVRLASPGAGPGAAPSMTATRGTRTPGDPAPVLIVGWPFGIAGELPGVTRELTEIGALLRSPKHEVTTLVEPTIEELRSAYHRVKPALLHLACSSVDRASGELRLTLQDHEGDPIWLTPADLCGLVSEPKAPALVVLSVSGAGLSAARALCNQLGTTAVGWAGEVTDDLAADFSSFFYERLLEGKTVVEALHLFRRRAAMTPRRSVEEAPVVWISSPGAALGSPPIEARPATPVSGGNTRGDTSSHPAQRTPEARIVIEPLAAINPALLLNGWPPFERLAVHAEEEQKGVRLTIVCDTGAGTSTYKQTIDLVRGLLPLDLEGLHFPALYELVRQRADRRHVNFVVSLESKGALLAEATRSVVWMSRDEWVDEPETWPFVPAFVQPDSDGVKEILDHAVRDLRKSGINAREFSGYQRRNRDAVRQQMRTIFATLSEAPFSIDYINPPSSPVYVRGSSVRRGQRVRLPDEIIKHKRGTCHDLALLFAACAEHIQIRPLVILMRDHTFFGFWTCQDAHEQYWAADDRRPARSSLPGHGWTIRSVDDLKQLAESAYIELIEATAVTKHASYEEACQLGDRRLSELRSRKLDAAVDVYAARPFVRPI